MLMNWILFSTFSNLLKLVTQWGILLHVSCVTNIHEKSRDNSRGGNDLHSNTWDVSCIDMWVPHNLCEMWRKVQLIYDIIHLYFILLSFCHLHSFLCIPHINILTLYLTTMFANLTPRCCVYTNICFRFVFNIHIQIGSQGCFPCFWMVDTKLQPLLFKKFSSFSPMFKVTSIRNYNGECNEVYNIWTNSAWHHLLQLWLESLIWSLYNHIWFIIVKNDYLHLKIKLALYQTSIYDSLATSKMPQEKMNWFIQVYL